MNKILLGGGLLLLMGLTACHHEEHHEEHHEQFLATGPIVRDTTVTREYVCQIHSIQHIEVRALEKGYLEKIYVNEGQKVKQGQLMYQIMPVVYQAEMKKAQAEVNYAEIEYKNTKSLADSNIVSKNELALALARLEKARAELQLAQAHLGFTEIRAPFDGIVDRLLVRLGSLLDEGELLTTLSDNSSMWVYFNVPEAEYLDYQTRNKGNSPMKVRLHMANNQLFEYPGVVETILGDFNNETGNIAYRATFPNPEGLLRHGETGNIHIDVPLKNAVIIPQKATFEVLDKKYVYVVGADNVLKTRKVTVAAELPNLYILGDGLKPDEKILLEGLRKVHDNDKVEYRFEEPEKVLHSLSIPTE